jgi:hypothetical protein
MTSCAALHGRDEFHVVPVDSPGFGRFNNGMTAEQVIEEVRRLPSRARAEVIAAALPQLDAEDRKEIERILRRLQHPDVPESFWSGVEDHEDGRTVDMDLVMREVPPSKE